MPDPQIKVDAVDWADIGDQLATGFVKAFRLANVDKSVVATLGKKEGYVVSMVLELVDEIALSLGEGLHKAEGPFLPIIAAFVAPIVSGLFGAHVDEGTFSRKLRSGDGAAAAAAVVDGLLRAIEGAERGELAPGDAGARRLAGAAVAASLESSFNALVPTLLSDVLPFDIGHFEGLLDLPEHVIRALGTGRLVQRALRPLVAATCTTPMQWHVNRLYRPELLSASDVVRQTLRGHWTRAEADEELARLGYSAKRIDALFNAGAKFFSPSDVRQFLSRGEWTEDQALQHLKDQGYDEPTARDALRLEGLRRFESLEGQEAAALVAAFASRDIDAGTFERLLAESVEPESERALWHELATVRQACNVRHLSVSQVAAMVKSGVASYRDYRDAAAGEGYDDDAILLLELQLRYEQDQTRAIAEHRAELERDRATEKAARAAELAAKRAAVDAQRAIARRGAEADLERAAVRGLIPIARVVEVYRAHYDEETVGILSGLLEDDRLAYVAQLQARADVAKRAAQKSLPIASIESAFYQGILTAGELAQRLRDLGFTAGDAAIVVSTAEARKADLDDAAAKRAEAEQRARSRSIDLARFEQLVRRGARTIAQYAALLASLGFDDGARAAIVDLLQLKIADDAKARDERAAAEARLKAKGLSLDQIRRAVILGVRTEDDYSRFLVQNNFTADAQLVLLDELRADVAEAAAARQRRGETGAPVDGRALPLATIRKAAQLGILTPAAYTERLVAAGYSADDIEIELQLLTQEIADVQARRDASDAAAAGAPARALSLADVERAVKAGELTIEDYRARAIESGLSPSDADLAAAVVADEQTTLNAARARRGNLALSLAVDGANLADVEARVKAGELALADYVAQLDAWGVDDADAQLLAALLALTLTTAKGGG